MKRLPKWVRLMLVCLPVLALLILFFKSSGDSLIDRAWHVPTSERASSPGGYLTTWPQRSNWLDDNSWLVVDNPSSGYQRLLRVDERTGHESPLTESVRLNLSNDPVLSPDRKLMYFEGYGVTDLSLHHLRSEAEFYDFTNALSPWSTDSKSLVMIWRNWIVRLYLDGRRPEQERLAINSPLLMSTSGPEYAEILLGFDAKGQAVATTWTAGQVIDVEMASFPVRRYAVPHTWTIKIPTDARVDELTLSPKGDRLLWTFRFVRESPFEIWLYKYFHREPGAHFVSDELWVSNLDGSRLQIIGAITDPPGGQSITGANSIIHASWSPDGKKASFAFNRLLYTIPIPE